MVERGAPFVQGPSFFRAESIFNRDLGVLSAILHRRQLPTPDYSVLDLFAGSGVRGLRYLQQAGATHVHCNDRNERLNGVLTANLEAAALKMTGPCTTEEVDLPGLVGSTARVWRKEGQPTAPPVCTLTHLSAEKWVVCSCLAPRVSALFTILFTNQPLVQRLVQQPLMTQVDAVARSH